MSDRRTERQRKADVALDDAIREVRAADHEASEAENPGLLSEWLVLGLEVGTDDVGSWSHDFRLAPDDGDLMPISHVLGLLRMALVKIEGRLARDRGDEE